MPGLGGADAGAGAPAGVLDAIAGHAGAEHVGRDLPMVGDAAGQLRGEAPLVVGGSDRSLERLCAATQVVQIAFDFPFAPVGGGVGIDFELERVLRRKRCRNEESQNTSQSDPAEESVTHKAEFNYRD